MVRALASLGANVDASMNVGGTPLTTAACKSHVAGVRELLKTGASARTALPQGNTALSPAYQKGHTEIVALLEKA
jgi:ankyrin repeat protein